ncbi:LysM peptidoglycan-binding domain-containing protein [Kyrpidia sp.]|uniref:M23 family metallopeptidase n=1 Tax=Kyrpidia sp. TaxID=2073077 RepID=UPI002588AE0D|nr:LysM peptidoglycan-binding domain-containing protein [Kyrpidia sp.]MCL6576664.1 LysM peptidoglycan-binding domain-containing protein [Kyrpidia sp.]
MKGRLIAAVLTGALLLPNPALAYTVKPGDTLWKIAQAHHVSVAQLMQVNHLTSTWIYPGQNLQIPGNSRTYTVVKGDSLWKIGQRYNVSVAAVKAANHLSGDLIYPGQVLKIPSGPSSDLGSTAPASTPTVRMPPAYQDGVFPLPKGSYSGFTDNFGAIRTWSPSGTTTRNHDGIDIVAPLGTPIYAAEGGTIINQGWSELGGWRLTVRVDGSTAFYYAHMSGYAGGMVKGATIKKGQLIGYVGNTGYGPVGTSGKFEAHLHFGMYKTSGSWQAIDPYPYLKWWESQR